MTPKQKQLFDYLSFEIEATGICPSFEEMMNTMGLHSKSGIHRLVNALKKQGLIDFLPRMSRTITIVKSGKEIRPNKLIKILKTLQADNSRLSGKCISLEEKLMRAGICPFEG